jgi:hypothetical protein
LKFVERMSFVMSKSKEKSKKELAGIITNMIDEGSEDVTTLSEDPEAKYESIAEKEPGKSED